MLFGKIRMDEATFINKLRLIEALFAGAATEGEKVAAERARNRILERLERLEKEDPPVEYRFSMADMWFRKVFVALLRRYELQPYRYRGQRYTTVMVKASKSFVDETLWPEFQEIYETLRTYLSDVTDRVVHQVIHQDSSEAEVVDKQRQLTLCTGNPGDASILTNKSPATSQEQAGRPSGPAGSNGSKGRSKGKRKKRKKRKRR
jgi:hypothetical protein